MWIWGCLQLQSRFLQLFASQWVCSLTEVLLQMFLRFQNSPKVRHIKRTSTQTDLINMSKCFRRGRSILIFSDKSLEIEIASSTVEYARRYFCVGGAYKRFIFIVIHSKETSPVALNSISHLRQKHSNPPISSTRFFSPAREFSRSLWYNDPPLCIQVRAAIHQLGCY